MKTEIFDESQLKALSNLMQFTIQQARYIYIYICYINDLRLSRFTFLLYYAHLSQPRFTSVLHSV